jgi:hypothetical protein
MTHTFVDVPCERLVEGDEVFIKIKEDDLLRTTGGQIMVVTRKAYRVAFPKPIDDSPSQEGSCSV